MSATAEATPRAREMAYTRHRVARYLAAVGGAVALLLFYQQWVSASLAGIGETSLTGLQLARGEASTRVNQGAVDASRVGAGTPSAAGTGAAPAAGSGGLTLPTRIATVAAGSSAPVAQPTVTPAAPAAAAPAGSGGLSLPTRVPTVAPGGVASGFGSTGPVTQATAPTGATGAAGPAQTAPPAAPPAPETLPRFALYLVALAGLGIAVFSVAWDWLGDPRDRFAGTLWTLLLSYGGALGSGSVLYRVITAPPGNVLLGPGVGGVSAAEPALWGVVFSFLLSAVCLTVAWLSPAPPLPDPYARARGPAL